MAFNSRLLKIAEMVRKGDRVADIGTDHAYLPVYLIKSCISSCVYACDVADGPLENARRNIEKTGTKGIVLRKGDGLLAVDSSEADTFILAGMGGDLIQRLISAADWIKNEKYELLLQPMTSVEALREYLCLEGFAIISEQAVRSQGRVYTVMKAVFTGKQQPCEPLFYYLGRLVDNIGDDELVYINRERRILCSLAKKIKDIESEKDRYEALVGVIADIDRLLG